MPSRVFLLSPASCSGNRARLLFSPSARFEMAEQLRSPEGAPLGEVFSFISQLYFRGKLAYGRAFARPPANDVKSAAADGVLVITTSRGLVRWNENATLETLREFAGVEMRGDGVYARELERGARALAECLSPDDHVVLLGSIASDKYVRVLSEVFQTRLLFPRDFVGRGDMSRGGLMLRAARTGRELDYIPLIGSVRHGVRPPRLEPERR
jgi:hypothetical protein